MIQRSSNFGFFGQEPRAFEIGGGHAVQTAKVLVYEILVLPDIFNVVPAGAAGVDVLSGTVILNLALGALDIIAPVLSLEDTQNSAAFAFLF